LNYLVDLVRALVWPAVVLTIALLFRYELQGLLRRLSRLSFRGATAEFKDDLARTQSAAKELPSPAVPRRGPVQGIEATLRRLAEESPRAAIMEAWRLVEAKLRALAESELGPMPARTQLMDRLRPLVNRGRLSPSLLDLVPNLKRTRNTAVHEPEADIGFHDAEAYIDISLSVLEWLSDTNGPTGGEAPAG